MMPRPLTLAIRCGFYVGCYLVMLNVALAWGLGFGSLQEFWGL